MASFPRRRCRARWPLERFAHAHEPVVDDARRRFGPQDVTTSWYAKSTLMLAMRRLVSVGQDLPQAARWTSIDDRPGRCRRARSHPPTAASATWRLNASRRSRAGTPRGAAPYRHQDKKNKTHHPHRPRRPPQSAALSTRPGGRGSESPDRPRQARRLLVMTCMSTGGSELMGLLRVAVSIRAPRARYGG